MYVRHCGGCYLERLVNVEAGFTNAVVVVVQVAVCAAWHSLEQCTVVETE